MGIKSDSPFLLPYKQSNDTSQCRIPLPHTAQICDRFGISNRAGAALATATLTNFRIITEENQLNVIGPSKLAAERHKYRQLLRERQHGNLQKITSLYYDGKRTATRVSTQNKITGKWSTSIKIQDHYIILDQPGSTYLAHVTPTSCSGFNIARNLFYGSLRKSHYVINLFLLLVQIELTPMSDLITQP